MSYGLLLVWRGKRCLNCRFRTEGKKRRHEKLRGRRCRIPNREINREYQSIKKPLGKGILNWCISWEDSCERSVPEMEFCSDF